ncbi:23S rRNA (adenine(2503)-C(2))-methyltransferase RlmN [Waddlia chondrophila]|uniref:Putative Fe-S-cluster redox enzyme, Cfr family n=1 Tax=Waddlia chondrophila (strain ATCC VR-1470 / WSU 86-1044) TaxID=716544 RepID=D6YVJ6_WADCW|nr:23S rRNA (adenine(2503)-C(2))-methyltransferase RlmN [Waddlia chondrophila]ADI38157.1 putative Fe-S-cluster redox enzyme, Cfr family [Waddlia chondrophila WSU 86-1044]
MIPILSHTRESYSQAVAKALGKGLQHAALLYREWMRTGNVSSKHPAFYNAPLLYEEILQVTDFSLPEISHQLTDGDVRKLLIRFDDGNVVESVVIPMQFGLSLCVSSQAGCRMGCTFCQTGRIGLKRHLRSEEIVAQGFIARHVLRLPIRNIVFMGMGEPMDNFDAVSQAIKVFSDQGGMAFGMRHLTVSTVGRVDGIRRFVSEVNPAVNLAVSINAPNDALRKTLMPLTRKYSLGTIKEALLDYCSHPRRSVLIGYVLIKGVNDSLELADELAAYIKGLRAKVNLIPYNPQESDPYETPESESVNAFAARLRAQGVSTLLRQTKGDEMMAACGQLGGVNKSVHSSQKSPFRPSFQELS